MILFKLLLEKEKLALINGDNPVDKEKLEKLSDQLFNLNKDFIHITSSSTANIEKQLEKFNNNNETYVSLMNNISDKKDIFLSIFQTVNRQQQEELEALQECKANDLNGQFKFIKAFLSKIETTIVYFDEKKNYLQSKKDALLQIKNVRMYYFDNNPYINLLDNKLN